MTSNPANTAAEPRTALLITLAAEILRFTGECEKPHRNGEANPHVHLEVTHRWGQRLAAIARAEAAQDRPTEPGLHGVKWMDPGRDEPPESGYWQCSCGKWFPPDGVDKYAEHVAASPPPAPEAGLDVVRLRQAIRNVMDADPAEWLEHGDMADAATAEYTCLTPAPEQSEPDGSASADPTEQESRP